MTQWFIVLCVATLCPLTACAHNSRLVLRVEATPESSSDDLGRMMAETINHCAMVNSVSSDLKGCLRYIDRSDAQLPKDCEEIFWHPKIVAYPVCSGRPDDAWGEAQYMTAHALCHFELLFTGALELSEADETCVPSSLDRRAERCRKALRKSVSKLHIAAQLKDRGR